MFLKYILPELFSLNQYRCCSSTVNGNWSLLETLLPNTYTLQSLYVFFTVFTVDVTIHCTLNTRQVSSLTPTVTIHSVALMMKRCSDAGDWLSSSQHYDDNNDDNNDDDGDDDEDDDDDDDDDNNDDDDEDNEDDDDDNNLCDPVRRLPSSPSCVDHCRLSVKNHFFSFSSSPSLGIYWVQATGGDAIWQPPLKYIATYLPHSSHCKTQ